MVMHVVGYQQISWQDNWGSKSGCRDYYSQISETQMSKDLLQFFTDNVKLDITSDPTYYNHFHIESYYTDCLRDTVTKKDISNTY